MNMISKNSLTSDKSSWWQRNGNFALIVVGTTLFLAFAKMTYFKVGYYLRTGQPVDWAAAYSSSDMIFGLVSNVLMVAIYLGIASLMKRWVPEHKIALRYGLVFILTVILGATVAIGHMYFYATVIYDFTPPPASFAFDTAVQALLTPLILMAILETFYYRGAWLKEQFEREQHKREMVAAKFEALSNQLSPHFVFNSFNTLGGLIGENKDQAEHFLNELSTVYRYILDNKDKETVSLARELESVHSFLSVQEARHPGTIQIEIDVNDRQKRLRIIPLTLHTLVENVFKHNRLSQDQPLNVSIKAVGNDLLVMENTLNEKLDVESHNIGISNLSKRYELIAEKGLEIIKKPDIFRVEVPVLEEGFATV